MKCLAYTHETERKTMKQPGSQSGRQAGNARLDKEMNVYKQSKTPPDIIEC